MRIRSIKPEFWTSLPVSNLPIEDRLLFIGLWSYVDDSGVGEDRGPQIAAHLFGDDLARNPRATLTRITEGLTRLSESGLIVRYEADGRQLLFIRSFSEHQTIRHPSRGHSYPLPTREDTESHADSGESHANVVRVSGETHANVAMEQGAGSREQVINTRSHPLAETDPTFDTWYQAFPRHTAKAAAAKAYRAALKSASVDDLLAGAQRYASSVAGTESRFIKHPATWLRGQCWLDEDTPAEPALQPIPQWWER